MAEQEDFFQLALFAAFELSASSPAADRFPAAFFPMMLVVLARDGGIRALQKARSAGVTRKEKEQASGGRRCGRKIYCGAAAVFMG